MSIKSSTPTGELPLCERARPRADSASLLPTKEDLQAPTMQLLREHPTIKPQAQPDEPACESRLTGPTTSRMRDPATGGKSGGRKPQTDSLEGRSLLGKSWRRAAPSGPTKRRSPCLVLVCLISGGLCLLADSPAWAALGQCLDKTMTSFERIGGVTIKDAQLTILYQANMSQATIGHHHHHSQQPALGGGPGPLNQSTTITTLYQISTPITAECNNRCRRMKECRAFLVDYSRHTCWSVNHPSAGAHHQAATSGPAGSGLGLGAGLSSGYSALNRSPAPIHLELTSERTAYFEKVCLNLPIVECERAWIFERVLSYHIHGHDDKIIDDVPSRLKCQEHCLNERQFRCRSGEYDYLTMQCRLSMVDRHMKQGQFRPTSSNVDYFENQCVPTGQQCDAFERFEDRDLGRAEIMRVVNNSELCQQFCTQTIKAFICRSFTWSPLTGRCYLNSANTFMVGGKEKLLEAPGLVYYQRNDCIDLKLECDTTSMTLNLRTNEPFRGRMYVRDGDPHACAPTLGRSALMASLSIPFQSPMGRCATRELPSRYSSVVVVQQHPLIQRKSDRYIKLVCDFQTANKTISSSYNVIANPWTSTALINATSFAPKILLRITDKFGHDVTGAKLGDELQLRIEAETDSPYDMAARSVVAKSGSSDEEIWLIDRDGCPADFRIFPPLKKLNKRTIIGRFDAFKFSSDAVVRFQVDVQFCLNSCPQTNCLDQGQAQLFNVNSQQLDAAEQSTAPMSTSTTSSPASQLGVQLSSTGAASPPAGQLDEGGPLEYMRSSPTTHRPLAGPDYLATNSLMDQYGGQLENSLLGTRRAQPPANQPLAEQQAQLAQSGSAPQLTATTGAAASGANQTPASDQLFDAQAKETGGRLLSPANEQAVYSGRAPAAQSGAHFHHAGGPSHHQSQKLPAHQHQHQQHKHQQQAYDSNHAVLQSNGLDHMGMGPDDLGPAMGDEPTGGDQGLRLRRRRRSTEPMPTTPKHVPLQREIIIFESATAKDDQARPDSPAGRQANGTGRQQTAAAGGKPARGQTDAPRPGQAKSAKRSHKGAGDQGADSNRYDLNQAEQLGGARPGESAADEQDGSRALVCTTWASVAFSLLAFCTLQLLTIGICLAGWLHKHKNKQADARSVATDDQRQGRFLSQFLRHQQQQQQQFQQRREQATLASCSPSQRFF